MTDAEHQADTNQRINRQTRLLAIFIAVLLGWYIAADRLTPYTSQARIEGFVVGVAPKVAGLVTAVHVANNTAVSKGQPLFDIDQADYSIALERSQSELEKARRQVSAGDASVAAARAGLDAALANEEKNLKDYNRLTRLFEQDPGTISERRLEMSRASLEAASAKVAAARADIERAIESKGGDSEVDNAFLLAAESAVKKAELDLANTVVRAQADGMVTDLRAEVGQFAAVGHPVLTLVASTDLWVNAAFTENNLGHLQVNTPVEIVFDVLPGKVFKGAVTSIGLGVSTGQGNPAGTLPTVQNNRDWLRQAQRFPVQIAVNEAQLQTIASQLRIGGQASVMALTDAPAPMRWLGQLAMRIRAWLSYAY